MVIIMSKGQKPIGEATGNQEKNQFLFAKPQRMGIV